MECLVKLNVLINIVLLVKIMFTRTFINSYRFFKCSSRIRSFKKITEVTVNIANNCYSTLCPGIQSLCEVTISPYSIRYYAKGKDKKKEKGTTIFLSIENLLQITFQEKQKYK